MNFTPELILRALPHRYPLLMVDRILEHEHGERAVCQKNVTLGEEVLVGHFPDDPIFPGVLIVEAGLQAAHLMLTNLADLKPESKPVPGYLLSISDFRFHEVVRPGDTLRLTVKRVHAFNGMLKVHVSVVNQDGVNVAEGHAVVAGRK